MTTPTPNNPMTEKLNMLSETTPGTPMGTLLRRFWQPVFRSEKVKGKTKPVKVMGEQLTIYRGESGKVYLVGGLCAHRCTVLHTGWVQDDELRCMYHGWQLRRPRASASRRRRKTRRAIPAVKIAGYPMHEYGGLIFAYLGEGPAPEFDLPRKDVLREARHDAVCARPDLAVQLVTDGRELDGRGPRQLRPSVGPVGTFGQAVAPVIPELDTSRPTPASARPPRVGQHVRVSDWTFPNNNHIIVPGVSLEDPWIDISICMTPLDDTHTTRFIIYGVPSTTPEADQKAREHFTKYGDYNPPDFHDELFHERKMPEEEIMQAYQRSGLCRGHGPGPDRDRLNERLGVSDQGVIFLRRLLWRETDLIKQGKPTKNWHRIEKVELPKQVRELEETT